MDNEQIIIDGIQFNKFGDFYVDYDLNGKFQSISSSAKEYKILKSLIKQLARKTQECEQYEQACDKIKEVCLEDTHTFADGTKLRYDSLDDILDIINKAKGEENVK